LRALNFHQESSGNPWGIPSLDFHQESFRNPWGIPSLDFHQESFRNPWGIPSRSFSIRCLDVWTSELWTSMRKVLKSMGNSVKSSGLPSRKFWKSMENFVKKSLDKMSMVVIWSTIFT